MDVPQDLVVAPGDDFHAGFDWFLDELLIQQLPLDAIAPEKVGGGLVFGPRKFRAVEFDFVVAVELVFLLQLLPDLRHAGLDALDVEIPDFVGGTRVAEQNVIGERAAVFRPELLDVVLREKEVVVIEVVEVVLQKLLR